MACYIFGAGDFDGLEERPGAADYVIAADGGYTACRRAGVEPQPARHAMSITAASIMHTTFFIVSFLLFQWF